MKALVFISLIGISGMALATEKEESSVAESAKAVVSGLVKFGKDLIEGADEGVNQGRKSGLSQDGAVLVDTGADLERLLSTKILAITPRESGGANVVMGFKNDNDTPVRLINLRESENVIAIDTEGYATHLAVNLTNPMEVTVPSKAGKKQPFQFDLSPEEIKEIRIMGRIFTR